MSELAPKHLKAPLWPRSRRGLKTLLAIGSAVVLVSGVAGWIGWRQLQKRLPIMISQELSGALGRPIRLGELQRFGLTGLRFGETILPPTAENFTWARVQVTDISLNPLDLIFRRTFRPSLLLIHPEVAIKQRFDRTWVLEAPDSADEEGKIKTEIGQIRIRNADISIGPVSRQEIVQAPEGFSNAQLIFLENVNLTVQFRGDNNELASLNLGGRLKNGTFQLRGESNLDTGKTNLTVLGKKLAIDTINPFLGGNLFLGEGYGYANLYAEFRPEQDPPFSIEGAARLQNGRALITGLPSQFEDIYGQFQFRGQSVTLDDTDLRFGPIEAQARGSVSLQAGFQVGIAVPDVSIEAVETAFDTSLPIDASGRFALTTTVRGPLREPRIQGRLANVSPVLVDRFGLNQVSADFSGNGETLWLEALQVIPTTGGQITAQGQVDFDENLLRARNLPPTALNLTASVDLPLDPVAELYGTNLPIEFGRLRAIANLTGPLLAPEGVAQWQLTDGIAVGSGRIDLAANRATIADTQLTIADAGAITATGQADLSTGLLDLNADARMPLDEIAQRAAIVLPAGLTLGTLTAQANATGPLLDPIAAALWQLQDGSVLGEGRLTYADQLVTLGDTTLAVGDGRLDATGQADFRTQWWQLGLAGNDLNLSQVSPRLSGAANVDITASGSLADLTPRGMRARGDLAFSAGLPLAIASANVLNEGSLPIDGPLRLAFDWNGSILGIPTLTAPGLEASGQIATLPDPNMGFPLPDNFDFAARLTDFDLARLNPLLPLASYGALLGGRLDFDGTLQGRLDDPLLNGEIALREATVGNLALLSEVQGAIAASPRRGTELHLLGDLTEIQAAVGRDRLPISLLFRNGAVMAEAHRAGDWLRGKVRDFPIEALGIRPVAAPGLGVVGGMLRSDFEVQMSTLYTNPRAQASFGIHRPAWGNYAGTAIQGRLRLANGRATLDNTWLDFPASRFEVAAAANLRSPRTAEATVTTPNARIEDLLAALQIADIADLQHLFSPRPLGTAADLATTPITPDPGDLANQILQAEQARSRQAQDAADKARALLPPLTDLGGAFSANLSLQASELNGVEMAFDVNGQDWVWGQYDFTNQFVAQGSWQDQVLTLDSIRLESGDALVNLAGVLALEGFNTQLEVANFDLAPIAQWLALPLPLQGKLNALASLQGAPGNPALRGTLAIDDAALNDYPLAIGSDFSYRDAWLRFDAQVKGEPDEPLLVRGAVPYALPFMTTSPDRDDLLVQASLGSGGFALLDMFSPYVAWGGGDASLLVEAKGSLAQPEVLGLIEFQDASVTSEFLTETLTELNGSIGFAGDRLQSSGLRGRLLGGQFSLVGALPFLTTTAATAPPSQPLTLSLDTLNFNFADELVSQINGEVMVSNSLQSPVIGGGVDLSGIRVRVGRNIFELANSLLSESGIEAAVAEFNQSLARFENVPGAFDNFTVRLSDVAELRVYPLVGIDAIGAVTLSGPIAQPLGDGYIELLDGWVNTVTADLFLVTSEHRNLVVLDADRGFNPYFDLLFQGDLPLQRQYSLPTSEFGFGNTSEVPDLDPLASVTLFDEILIEAEIKGYLSEGMEVLTLSSTPFYAENSLLSMLSGGYLADLPAGEPALATGSNLLFALFTEQQEAIGDFLGLRRLRFGATTTLPGDEGDLFGIGVGVNVGVTDSISAGLVQVLNRSQPYQLNLQYRINNEFGVGGSTDLSDESRVFMQYRRNF